MEDAMMPAASLASIGRAILSKFDRESIMAITEALREELHESIRLEERERAQAEVEATLNSGREALEEAKAKILAESLHEIENQVEAQTQKVEAHIKDEFESDMEHLQKLIATANTRIQSLERAFLAVINGFFPLGKRTYPARMLTIKEFPLNDINGILNTLGYRLRATHTGSHMVVACKLKDGHVQGRNLFELRKLNDDVADDEKPGDPSTLAEISTDGQTI